MTTNECWLSTQDLAQRYGVPLATVRKWRYEGHAPTGVKFGRHVRYALSEVERWEREQAAKASA
jgi:excisionase family DNA binding protein